MRIDEADHKRKKAMSLVVGAALVAAVVLPLLYVAVGSIIAIVRIVLG
ncbi:MULTISPECIES: hypothetical protein [Rhizobium]|nr:MULTISPECIES: hypothetical protein [Rhizobium]